MKSLFPVTRSFGKVFWSPNDRWNERNFFLLTSWCRDVFNTCETSRVRCFAKVVKETHIEKAFLNPIQDGLFWGFSRMGGRGRAKRLPLPEICHTCPAIMKLVTVIPFLKKIEKMYESRDTLFKFCWHLHFFHQKSANFAISSNRYRLHIDT